MGRGCFSEDFLVGPAPYDVVLELNWITEHKVAWYFHPDWLRTYANGKRCELAIARTSVEKAETDSGVEARQRNPPEQGYDVLAKQAAGMTPEGAAALLCQPPKRYKSYARAEMKVTVDALVQQAEVHMKCLRGPLHGLHLIIAVPNTEGMVALKIRNERQGALL